MGDHGMRQGFMGEVVRLRGPEVRAGHGVFKEFWLSDGGRQRWFIDNHFWLISSYLLFLSDRSPPSNGSLPGYHCLLPVSMKIFYQLHQSPKPYM